jgi:hypothetical protein
MKKSLPFELIIPLVITTGYKELRNQVATPIGELTITGVGYEIQEENGVDYEYDIDDMTSTARLKDMVEFEHAMSSLADVTHNAIMGHLAYLFSDRSIEIVHALRSRRA